MRHEPNMNTRMGYTEWLRRQVSRIEEVIQRHPVFDASEAATAGQLSELRGIVVIYTFLKQQLLRREPAVVVPDDDYETQEFVLVRKTV